MNEHSDEKRLVPGFGPGRELERHCPDKASFVERPNGDTQARGSHRTPQPPGLWLRGTLLRCGNECVRGSCVGIKHQLAVARYIRSTQRCNVHVDCDLTQS